MLVKLIDQLRVFLLLGHDFFRLLFDVIPVYCHKALHLFSIILSLHGELNSLNKLLNLVLLLLGRYLRFLSLLLKIFDGVFLLLNILLHLLQTFRLHVKQLL